MSYPALPDQQRVPSLHGWHLAAGGAFVAVVLQLWGLYRATGPPQPSWIPIADKLAHAIGFALPVMLILLAVGLHPRLRSQWLTRGITALVVGIFGVHAVVSELIQHVWYQDRTGDLLDVVADWVGIAAAAVLVRLILRGSRSTYRVLAP
jgi:VanZ family protein